jgi:general secretion pathway protein B
VSYILDALKHSDDERSRGKIPDLQSQPHSITMNKQRRNTPLIWFLILGLAVVLGYMFVAKTTTQVEQVLIKEVPVVSEESVTLATMTNTETVPVKASPVITLSSTEEADELRLSPEILQQMQGVQLNAQSTSKAAPISVVSAPPLSVTVSEIRNKVSSTNEVAKLPPGKIVSSTVMSVSETNPYQGIPHVKQLPSDTQRQIPPLNFSVHMYAENPVARMVIFNGERYRQGSQLNHNLKLVQITRDGVILEYKSKVFWYKTR